SPLGIAGYLRITPNHGVIEIGHLHFSKLLKQTPLATEAIYLMLKQVFDEYKYRRCEWKCNNLNEPSHKAAKRFGFTFEGIFRQHYVFKNQNRDTAWYSIIDSEWPILKEKFEKWLHSNNFTPSGKQILKLAEI
ncbi:MAG: GNAT family N-acetyltransferase, partial [Gammaproteobacteria bacterium]|nr:GNAT family N-acetyltransferase [Gammaproteobacteria bacterium]